MESFRARILVVDDEDSNLIAMQKILEQEAYQVVCVKQAAAAITIFKKQTFDLILTDLRMPGISGLELLRAIRRENTRMPVVILTAYGTVNDAVEAMKLGAIDFLAKPLRREKILKVVQDVLSRGSTVSKEKIVFLGQSAEINQIKRSVKMLAQTSASVLVEGESGTGKEIVAKLIHVESARPGKLISINCGAIPESLLESELFGYERGAFTGAVSDKQGMFELADKGTLFLDEIGDMPISLQVKLLRVLQDGCFFRLGGTEPKKVDVRIIAATNADLKRKIIEGNFREDLFYRLNVVLLQLPSLRDRSEDIPLLAQYFLDLAKEQYGKKSVIFSPDAVSMMQSYSWPGNIRELKNIIERTLVTLDGENIRASDLKLPVLEGRKIENVQQEESFLKFSLGTTLREIELEAIRKTLEYTGGDKIRAAELLGINQRTIYRKISEL